MSHTRARSGWVYLVGAGPGDPDLITVRGAELLASADVVLHDELIDPALLERATGEVRSVGKRGSSARSKQARQDAINRDLVALARAGQSVVRLKGGDPFLFGRGSEEARELRAAAIPFEVVPGVPAPVGATGYAGIPLTHRDIASSVTFITAVKRDGKMFDWSELAQLKGTLCIFMGTHRLAEIAEGLIDKGRRAPSTPAAAVQWISYPRQHTVVGTLADIAARASKLGSPSLLIVGDVVALRPDVRWYDAQALFGKRVLVTRPAHQIAPTAKQLRQRGAEAVPFPTIQLQPPPDPEAVARAVRELASYDLVAFTSDNGVDWLWREIDRQGRDARAFGNAKIAAIGPATAQGLRRRGVVADIVAESYIAETLAENILQKLQPGARVLVPRALVAREILPERLREAGMHVDVVPVYQTVSSGVDKREELRALVASVDIVTLTSSSTVTMLSEILGDDAPARLAHCLLASIGPVTTKTAEDLGLHVAVTAEVSTSVGLIDALERALRESAP
ncbi:MAG TPA: uroporphyrinogen-III C-methyltransferase [Polyangiaceae bacterium]|nr:uroporphyrinogen-III C-methyltransferase [Polyangiaceae bacterium]